jgi:hypothetical protein
MMFFTDNLIHATPQFIFVDQIFKLDKFKSEKAIGENKREAFSVAS